MIMLTTEEKSLLLLFPLFGEHVFFLETKFGQEFSNGSSFSKKLKQTLFGSKCVRTTIKKKTLPKNAHDLVKVLLL
jgi:hypothetical protein